jgi:hypothetical protein
VRAQVVYSSGQVFEHHVPRCRGASKRRLDETSGMVMKRRQSPPFRADVAARERMAVIAADFEDLVTSNRYHHAAQSPAAPADAQMLRRRARTIEPGHPAAALSRAAVTALDTSMASAVLYMSSS